MKLPMPFDLKIPVLYVNPGINADPGLVEEVSRAGGLGIVDHVTTGPAEFKASPDIPHGVRVLIKDLERFASAEGTKLVLIPLEEAEQVSSLEPGALKENGVPVLVEVGSARQAAAAEKAGAAGLIARGNEGPGWVSETSGLVLLQEIRALSDLPLFLQGGVSPRTAAGARAAGATGVVLDVHLLLADGSQVNPSLKDFLNSLGLPTTVTLADGTGTPLRVYSRVGTRMVRELKKQEDALPAQDFPSYRERLQVVLQGRGISPDSEEMLLPMSEDIGTGKVLAGAHGNAKAIVAVFGQAMAEIGHAWPFLRRFFTLSRPRDALPHSSRPHGSRERQPQLSCRSSRRRRSALSRHGEHAGPDCSRGDQSRRRKDQRPVRCWSHRTGTKQKLLRGTSGDNEG